MGGVIFESGRVLWPTPTGTAGRTFLTNTPHRFLLRQILGSRLPIAVVL